MLNFFETIIDYIELVWNFFLNLINSLLSLVTAVAGAMIIPQSLPVYVFGPLGACILATSAFAVIKMLVGRSSV